MNKYDTPPIVLLDDLRTVIDPESDGAPFPSDTVVKTTPARFLVFMQEDSGWVLRDYAADRDYPFHSRAAAVKGIELRNGRRFDFIGAPCGINAYGEPLENVEVFA